MTTWQLLSFIIIGLGLLSQQLQQQVQAAEELMVEIEDDPYTDQNESGFRPAVVIEEQEDGSIIVYTKQGNQTIATYDSMYSMMLGLDQVLRQMPNWNFTK